MTGGVHGRGHTVSQYRGDRRCERVVIALCCPVQSVGYSGGSVEDEVLEAANNQFNVISSDCT